MSKSSARFSNILCVRYRAIAELVAKAYDIDWREFEGKNRHKYLSEARLVLYYVMRHATDPQLSYPEIGGVCGWRDHSTVIAGVRSIARRMTKDARLRELVERLLNEARALYGLVPTPVAKAPSVPPPAIPDLEVVA